MFTIILFLKLINLAALGLSCGMGGSSSHHAGSLMAVQGL